MAPTGKFGNEWAARKMVTNHPKVLWGPLILYPTFYL